MVMEAVENNIDTVMSEEGLRRAAQLYQDIEESAGLVTNMNSLDFYYGCCYTKTPIIIHDQRLVQEIKDVIRKHYEELKNERSAF